MCPGLSDVVATSIRLVWSLGCVRKHMLSYWNATVQLLPVLGRHIELLGIRLCQLGLYTCPLECPLSKTYTRLLEFFQCIDLD